VDRSKEALIQASLSTRSNNSSSNNRTIKNKLKNKLCPKETRRRIWTTKIRI